MDVCVLDQEEGGEALRWGSEKGGESLREVHLSVYVMKRSMYPPNVVYR